MKVIRDMGKLEAILEAPGDLKLVLTIQLLRKGDHVLFEMESDEGISRRLLRKLLRRASHEL